MFNAQIIHKSLSGTLSPLKFREQLIHDIIVKYKAEECQVRCGAHGQGGVRGDCELRLVGHHFPSYVEDTNSKKKSSRRCVVCKKHGKRKETRFICKDCDVGLCAVPCFKDYHCKNSINERSFMLISVFFWYACLSVSTFLVYTVTYYRCLILNKYQCGVQILPF